MTRVAETHSAPLHIREAVRGRARPSYGRLVHRCRRNRCQAGKDIVAKRIGVTQADSMELFRLGVSVTHSPTQLCKTWASERVSGGRELLSRKIFFGFQWSALATFFARATN